MKDFIWSVKVKLKSFMKSKLPDYLLSWLMWTWGATLYFFIEVIYKTLTGNPDHISWTMIVVAFILCIPLERMGDELPWEMPMALQCVLSCIVITITELISGLILNVWLGLNVWDYTELPFNFMGQICLQFSMIWLILSYFGIKIFDWIRYAIIGGIRPQYKMFKRCEIKNDLNDKK